MTLLEREINEILEGLEPLPPAPPGRPRWTAPWQKSGAQVVAELRALSQDRSIVAAINGCGILAGIEGDTNLPTALNTLLAMAATKAPTAVHCLGEIGLTDYLLSQIMAQMHLRAGQIAQAVAVLNAMSERLRFRHFQGNPALLRPDGGVTIPPAADVSLANFSDLRGFQASQRPKGKAGRPRKAAKRMGRARPRISDKAIRDTGTMSVSAWAAEYAPDLDMGDKRQAKAAYARFDRAAYRRRLREP